MQTQSTINLKALTFEDWQVIAAGCDNSSTWAFFRWIENASQEQLQAVSRAEIKKIAEMIGYGSGFVADKLDEYC